jgi:hypothetical protein
LSARNSGDSAVDVLWMSVLACLGGTFIEVVLLGGYHLFDPVAGAIIENHSSYCLWSLLIVFVAGLGISLQLTLAMQLRRSESKESR